MDDIQTVLKQLKLTDEQTDNLKDEIEKRGLQGEVADFQKKYSKDLSEYLKAANIREGMSKEEKTKAVMDIQSKLTSEQQKQFKSVMNALKNYLKRK